MTTTHSHHRHARRRVDLAGAFLLVFGLFFGAVVYWLIEEHQVNALFLVPSVVAVTVGGAHLTKWEAPRD